MFSTGLKLFELEIITWQFISWHNFSIILQIYYFKHKQISIASKFTRENYGIRF